MIHSRTKSAPVLVLAGALIVPLILVLGARPGTGQDKAATAAKPSRIGQQGTIESHDRTNFPLVGKHRTLACRECHINLVFEGTPTDCEVCHWERRQDDRYSLRLGMRCADCHTPQSWKERVDPGLWNHETNAGFRLEGIHRTLDCEACHGSGGFSIRPTDCFGCHEADYRGTQDPNHVQAGFPTTCSACHSQRSWSDASTAHTGLFGGRHATAACSDCHINGVYQGTSTECASCHLADYNGTTDPNHRASGFPLDCSQCHGTSATGWTGADFAHTGFVLQGRHATAACADCHANGVYHGTSTECASCHLASYNGTTNPNHRASGFPLDCAQCHGTSSTGWTGATFIHTGFVLRGRHALAACADCHANGVYQGTPADCSSCHLADYNGTTNPNHRASGFPLDCTQCHGTSAAGWTGAIFDHPFPIQSGRHSGLACSECHQTSDLRVFNCLGCHEKASVDGHHSGVTGYAYNSPACYACHPNGSAGDRPAGPTGGPAAARI